MIGSVRRAGTGLDEAGALVVWSVAEGSRGRRWREVRTIGRGVVGSLLLETDPSQRFSHTEFATSAGLLTLHPENDGSIHGNVVTDAGIRHVSGMPWEPDGLLLVEGSPTAAAAAAAYLFATCGTQAPSAWPAVVVGLDLTVRAERVDVERVGESRWRFGSAGAAVEIDPDGLPLLAEARTWPLEEA